MSKNVLIFDSACLLCHRLVHILVRYDTDKRLKFASSGSNYAKSKIELRAIDLSRTLVYINEQGIFTKSRAVFHLLRDICPKRGILWFFSVFSFKVLDKLYDVIAANRYRIKNAKGCAYSTDVTERLLL